MTTEPDVVTRIATLTERVTEHDAALGRLAVRLAELEDFVRPAVPIATSAEMRARDVERRLAIGEGTLAGLALRCEELERRFERLANAPDRTV